MGAERLNALHQKWPCPKFGVSLGQGGFQRTAYLEKVSVRENDIFAEMRCEQEIQLPTESVNVSLESRVHWLLRSLVHLHRPCCHDLPPDLCKSAAFNCRCTRCA
jgi:hypothetical protein